MYDERIERAQLDQLYCGVTAGILHHLRRLAIAVLFILILIPEWPVVAGSIAAVFLAFPIRCGLELAEFHALLAASSLDDVIALSLQHGASARIQALQRLCCDIRLQARLRNSATRPADAAAVRVDEPIERATAKGSTSLRLRLPIDIRWLQHE